MGREKKGKKEKGEICIIDSLKRRLQRNLTLTARSSFMRLIIAAFYALNFSLVDMRRSPFNWNTEGRTGWAISRRGSEMADIRCVSFQGEKMLGKMEKFYFHLDRSKIWKRFSRARKKSPSLNREFERSSTSFRRLDFGPRNRLKNSKNKRIRSLKNEKNKFTSRRRVSTQYPI